MSGGSMDYLYSKVEENVAYLGDPIIIAMALDFAKVLHDAEWAEDGDISKVDYLETLNSFKRKWLKKTKLTQKDAAEVARVAKECRA